MADDRRSPVDDAPISRAGRYERIVAVLARHGFALVEDRISHGHVNDRVAAVQLREALEALGTVYIKLGQFMSAQSASLPPAFREELGKLDDDVPPAPGAEIRLAIEAALGEPVSELFASFEDEPLGSASIGQVHAARLVDGREIVLKVKKPGVDALVATDLSILQDLVRRLEPHWSLLRDVRADELMPEFVRTLDAELDFAAEAASTRLFHRHFAGKQGIEIPEIVDDRTRGDVICETRLVGRPLLDGARNMDAGARATLVSRIVTLVLEPGLAVGTFHADPHAGNLMVTEAGSLGVLDFGKVGRLGRADRSALTSMLLAVGSQDADRLATALLSLAGSSGPVDERAIAAEIDVLLQRYADVAVSGIGFRAALGDLLTLFRTNGLTVPGRIVLFFKALAMSEGLIRDIEPKARFAELLRPVLKRIMVERVTGDHAAMRLLGWGIEAGSTLADRPSRLDRTLTAATEGRLRIWSSVEGLPDALERLDGMVDRLSAAVLVAAGIIGTAVVLQLYHPAVPQGVGAVPWILAGVALSFVVRAVGRRMRRR